LSKGFTKILFCLDNNIKKFKHLESPLYFNRPAQNIRRSNQKIFKAKFHKNSQKKKIFFTTKKISSTNVLKIEAYRLSLPSPPHVIICYPFIVNNLLTNLLIQQARTSNHEKNFVNLTTLVATTTSEKNCNLFKSSFD
jgi:hypothetical protein